MHNPNPRNRPAGGKATDLRWMITAVSLTSTLFFWYLFSRQELSSAAASPDPQVAPPLSNSQVSDAAILTLNLPPMPTLVPPLSDLANGVASQPAADMSPAQARSSLAAPAPAQGAVKIMLGGAAPQAPHPARNSRPAARTHSS
jgi:hypothetical protein